MQAVQAECTLHAHTAYMQSYELYATNGAADASAYEEVCELLFRRIHAVRCAAALQLVHAR